MWAIATNYLFELFLNTYVFYCRYVATHGVGICGISFIVVLAEYTNIKWRNGDMYIKSGL